MKWLLLADVHSNLEALQAVLSDAKKTGFSKVLCLGDIVGYASNPNECIELLRKQNAVCLLGNHDAAVAGIIGIEWFNPLAAECIEWTKQVIKKENISFLQELPKFFSTGEILFVHGTPSDPLMAYMDAIAAEEVMRASEEKIVICSHSHKPFRIEHNKEAKNISGSEKFSIANKRMVVSIPSTGQPRDGNAKAGYAIIDFKEQTMEIKRIVYDIAKAAQKIIAAKLPAFEAERLFVGR